MSIELLCNQALDLIGYPRHIGNIYEGTKAARIALNIFGETRDEVLEAREWSFARVENVLIQAGQIAPLPWIYEYIFPATSIKLWAVKPAFIPADPEPVHWLEGYDDRILGARRVIYTSFNPAVGVFTNRVINIDDWPPDFRMAFIGTLAKKMQMELASQAQMSRKEQTDDTRGRDQ